MAHHPSAGHASPDDEYLETPPGSTYEHTDASARPLVQVPVLAAWCRRSSSTSAWPASYELLVRTGVAREAAERRYPLSAAQPHRLPPAPRLQQFPENERFVFQSEEQRLLNWYAWENKEAGTVRIPIAEAMRLTVERGLPSPARRPPTGRPGLMPADSSSGPHGGAAAAVEECDASTARLVRLAPSCGRSWRPAS